MMALGVLSHLTARVSPSPTISASSARTTSCTRRVRATADDLGDADGVGRPYGWTCFSRSWRFRRFIDRHPSHVGDRAYRSRDHSATGVAARREGGPRPRTQRRIRRPAAGDEARRTPAPPGAIARRRASRSAQSRRHTEWSASASPRRMESRRRWSPCGRCADVANAGMLYTSTVPLIPGLLNFRVTIVAVRPPLIGTIPVPL